MPVTLSFTSFRPERVTLDKSMNELSDGKLTAFREADNLVGEVLVGKSERAP